MDGMLKAVCILGGAGIVVMSYIIILALCRISAISEEREEHMYHDPKGWW